MTESSGASPADSSTDRPAAEPFEFVGDAGPGFDPEAGAQAGDELRAEQDALAGQVVELPEVREEQVRAVLRNVTDGVHALVGVGENDWRATQSDMDRIAPPATSIVNRYRTTRAIAQKSDEAALIIGLGLYSWRSMLERQAALALRELEEQEAGAPRPAPGPSPAAAPPPPPESPPPSTPAGGAGGAWPTAIPVADGYTPMAERVRAARERTPNAQPRQDPPAG